MINRADFANTFKGAALYTIAQLEFAEQQYLDAYDYEERQYWQGKANAYWDILAQMTGEMANLDVAKEIVNAM